MMVRSAMAMRRRSMSTVPDRYFSQIGISDILLKKLEPMARTTPVKTSPTLCFPTKPKKRRVSDPLSELILSASPKLLHFGRMSRATAARPPRFSCSNQSKFASSVSIIKASDREQCSSPEDSGYETNSPKSYADPSTPMSCESGDTVVPCFTHSSSFDCNDVSNEDAVATNRPSNSGQRLCNWNNCQALEITQESIAEHVVKCHIDPQRSAATFVCLWNGCRVFNKVSKSISWLEAHVVGKHCGPRPYKCVVPTCSQGFCTKAAAERHINQHLNRVNAEEITSEATMMFYRDTCTQSPSHRGNSQHQAPTCHNNASFVATVESRNNLPLQNFRKKYNIRNRNCTGFRELYANNKHRTLPSQEMPKCSELVTELCAKNAATIKPTLSSSTCSLNPCITRKRRNGAVVLQNWGRRVTRLVVPTVLSRKFASQIQRNSKSRDTTKPNVCAALNSTATNIRSLVRKKPKNKSGTMIINRSRDFLDSRSVEFMRNTVLQPSAFSGQADPAGGLVVKLHAEIIATRVDNAGNTALFVQWLPEGILNAEWVKKEHYKKVIDIPLRRLRALI